MSRRAFHKIGRVSGLNSASLAVPPFLFLASLFTPTANGSPATTAQAGPLNPLDTFHVQSLVANVSRTDPQEFQSRSAFLSPSLVLASAIDEIPMQSVNRSFASVQEEQRYECYPYLLLTLGLILLAFRPASPAAGRP